MDTKKRKGKVWLTQRSFSPSNPPNTILQGRHHWILGLPPPKTICDWKKCQQASVFFHLYQNDGGGLPDIFSSTGTALKQSVETTATTNSFSIASMCPNKSVIQQFFSLNETWETMNIYQSNIWWYTLKNVGIKQWPKACQPTSVVLKLRKEH